jgi:hypothetical protein
MKKGYRQLSIRCVLHKSMPRSILLFVGTLCLLATGCATRSSRFEFGVIGDVPYRLDEEARVAAAITDMNRSDLVFVLHVGDIQALQPAPTHPCSGARSCSTPHAIHSF